LMLLLCLCLAGCKVGDVSSAERTVSVSKIFTESEIEKAMNIVTSHFETHFDGCKLTELYYDEEHSAVEAAHWAKQYEAEEAIVLLSTFEVGERGGDGSLNPNSTYEGWGWVLIRNKGESWKLKTWGY